MKEYYEVRLVIATEDGDPDEWGWEELIGDTVIEVNSKKMELVEVAKTDEPDDDENEYANSPFIQVLVKDGDDEVWA